jgi:hypothetical protein
VIGLPRFRGDASRNCVERFRGNLLDELFPQVVALQGRVKSTKNHHLGADMTTQELMAELESLSRVRLDFMLAYVNGVEPELVLRAMDFVKGAE